MIRRSLRLDAIYAWVDGNVVADIGCDHGYIPLWCVQDKGIKAYACDVASKPLERARALFKQEEADIPCLLMDGIEGLPGDVDQIVIAGMGGQLIEHIRTCICCVRICERRDGASKKSVSCRRETTFIRFCT